MFITLIKQTGFDYTEWRKDNLWVGLTSEKISNRAVDVICAHIDELPENIRTAVQTKNIHALNNVTQS
jgi:hypothetical protein